MSALTEPLESTRVEDPDPETVTARRRDLNQRYGLHLEPSEYELEFYARVGRTPPTD